MPLSVAQERQDNSKLWLRVLIGAWRGPCLAALLASNYLDAMLKSSDEVRPHAARLRSKRLLSLGCLMQVVR